MNTAADIARANALLIRPIVRAIGSKHGLKISVRARVKGSLKGRVGVMCNYGPAMDAKDTTPRIELCEALKAAGFEESHYYLMGSTYGLDGELRMAREHGHWTINLELVARKED